ncbi:alpha/beta hydrolase [Streptomyces sp. NPDC096324]|uniref:alpha/beta hydrolase n=1 Tax=Streptomyces sp. NPDC096324 TaxID=3366085 RepID=UPI00380631B3
MVEVMRSIGHIRFALAGTTAEAASRCVSRSIIPTRFAGGADDCLPLTEHLSRITIEFATQWWHRFFFAQPDIPERVMKVDPDSWYRGDPQVKSWRHWARDVRGHGIDDRHHVAEEAPEVLASPLANFFAGQRE